VLKFAVVAVIILLVSAIINGVGGNYGVAMVCSISAAMISITISALGL
jgi:hypothetical protein